VRGEANISFYTPLMDLLLKMSDDNKLDHHNNSQNDGGCNKKFRFHNVKNLETTIEITINALQAIYYTPKMLSILKNKGF